MFNYEIVTTKSVLKFSTNCWASARKTVKRSGKGKIKSIKATPVSK